MFTADEHHIVAGFRDGSFHMWDADTGAPARSFMLPPSALPEGVSGHHVLCSQGLGATTFAVSRDSQLVVAGGAHLPALLVFSLVGVAVVSGCWCHPMLILSRSQSTCFPTRHWCMRLSTHWAVDRYRM